MGDLLKFALQDTEDKGFKPSPGLKKSAHVRLPWVLLAIAHYVKEGDQDAARQLLSYVSVHVPLPEVLLLPADLAVMVANSNPGAALTSE